MMDHLMRLGELLEVLRLDAEGDGNVILDQTQPLYLLVRKMYRACVPAQGPLHEVIIHLVRKGREVVGIAHLEADD